MKEPVKRRKFDFSGHAVDHSIVIGNHGNASFKAEGDFDLSGIIYNPRNTVTFRINGDGHMAFRGKCHRIVIKKMMGNCTLDLTEVVCQELQCENIGERATIITGKVRSISHAFLKDDATLHLSATPVVLNYSSSGNSKVVLPSMSSNYSVEN